MDGPRRIDSCSIIGGMDFSDLLHSCRVGDLERIRYLVEQKEVELNLHDKWDSTPLYYACLCGHYDVVKYLLDNGAICEANTFDGERCLYGALNSEIRNLLRDYKVVSSTVIRRELYQEFLRRLFEYPEFADMCFIVHNRKFFVHKCVLSARSDYFNDMFLDKWIDRREVHIRHELVSPYAFHGLLQFLYEGRVEIHIDYIDDLQRLAKQCKITTLMERLEDMADKAHFFECTKPGTKVTNLVIETSDPLELSSDFGILAEEALPLYMCNWIGSSELPFYPEERAPFADVIFSVDGVRFKCHKAFFCLRSEYFKTLLTNPLQEPFTSEIDDYQYKVNGEECGIENESTIPVIKLRDICVTIFSHVLYYIYQDYARITSDTVYDVLIAADMYLLPGLKRQCGAYIGNFLDVFNIWSALKTARLFELPRLEDQCYQFLAENLERVIGCEEFQNFIREDAKAVQKRQDVDSIDIVDNIRFHLTATSMDDARDKLSMMDSLLEDLDLMA